MKSKDIDRASKVHCTFAFFVADSGCPLIREFEPLQAGSALRLTSSPGPLVRIERVGSNQCHLPANTIEGLNGYIKDPAHECLQAPERRRRGPPAR